MRGGRKGEILLFVCPPPGTRAMLREWSRTRAGAAAEGQTADRADGRGCRSSPPSTCTSIRAHRCHPRFYLRAGEAIPRCAAPSGSAIEFDTRPGRRCAAVAAALCPGLIWGCPFGGDLISDLLNSDERIPRLTSGARP